MQHQYAPSTYGNKNIVVSKDTQRLVAADQQQIDWFNGGAAMENKL